MDEKELEKDIPQDALLEEDEDEDDIEFDDDVNFDELTQQLQEHIDVEDSLNTEEDIAPANISAEEALSKSGLPSLTASENVAISSENSLSDEVSPLDIFPKDECKKYVVYITPENVDFVDNLSIDDRNRLINKVIYEKHVLDTKAVALEYKKRYAKHLIIVCITVILGFPLMFFIVNKSLQASISNYEQTQKNFQKLYKEKGKITNYQKLEEQQ